MDGHTKASESVTADLHRLLGPLDPQPVCWWLIYLNEQHDMEGHPSSGKWTNVTAELDRLLGLAWPPTLCWWCVYSDVSCAWNVPVAGVQSWRRKGGRQVASQPTGCWACSQVPNVESSTLVILPYILAELPFEILYEIISRLIRTSPGTMYSEYIFVNNGDYFFLYEMTVLIKDKGKTRIVWLHLYH